MKSSQISSAGKARNFHPEILRQARLRRFGLSSATSRAIAALAYGEPLDEWCWIPLGEAAAAAIDSAAEAYGRQP